jgi:hypothetical protein
MWGDNADQLKLECSPGDAEKYACPKTFPRAVLYFSSVALQALLLLIQPPFTLAFYFSYYFPPLPSTVRDSAPLLTHSNVMRRITKACDPCRHARRRCEFEPNAAHCVTCLTTGSLCAFNRPRNKRGPKPRASEASPSIVESCEPHLVEVPESTWDDLGSCTTTGDDVQSPAGAHMLASLPTGLASISTDPVRIGKALQAAIAAAGCSPASIVEQCSALYMRWVFPVLPLVGSADLQDFSVLSYYEVEPSSMDSGLISSGDAAPAIDRMRKFALLTSAYATVCVKVPKTAFPVASLLVSPFLAASRAMLSLCEDQDVTMPNACSLIIRTLQAAVLHALGQTQLSWFILGHSVRLAQAMRLYEEVSYKGLDAKEAQLRRNAYWILHTVDKAASVLHQQTATLHQAYLPGPVRTECEYKPDQLTLLDRDSDTYGWPYEEHVHIATYICHRLWALCDDIRFSLQLLGRIRSESDADVGTDGSIHTSITDSYMNFCGILDEMPPWLCNPDSYVGSNEHTTAYQRHAFWIQRADVTVTFHSLRFLLLKEAADLNLSAFLGVTGGSGLLSLRQIEIAVDLTTAAGALPVESLRANGQPLVSSAYH